MFQAYEEAGIQVQSVKALPSSADVTLNALNAGEPEGGAAERRGRRYHRW